jgi:hypothetical protein
MGCPLSRQKPEGYSMFAKNEKNIFLVEYV